MTFLDRACDKNFSFYCREMELTQQQCNKISDRILYILENGCKWRCLPKRFGSWHSIYTRMNRWSKNGVLDRILARLQENKIFHVSNGSFSLDSTVIKVHPDGTGALKKRPAVGWEILWRLDNKTSSDCDFSLSPGQARDAPEGRSLLMKLVETSVPCAMIMDKAYEDDETRKLVSELGFSPVVPPKSNRREPWEHDKKL